MSAISSAKIDSYRLHVWRDENEWNWSTGIDNGPFARGFASTVEDAKAQAVQAVEDHRSGGLLEGRGNEYLKWDGQLVTIYRDFPHWWGACIFNDAAGTKAFLKGFNTPQAAKLAAFERVVPKPPLSL
jgi:hypothetical protein